MIGRTVGAAILATVLAANVWAGCALTIRDPAGALVARIGADGTVRDRAGAMIGHAGSVIRDHRGRRLGAIAQPAGFLFASPLPVAAGSHAAAARERCPHSSGSRTTRTVRSSPSRTTVSATSAPTPAASNS